VITAKRWVLPVLVLGFIAISILEVWLLTLVGTRIGIGWTVAILIAEAVLGSWLLVREGRKAWSALWDALSLGRMPSGQLADAALVLVGGMFLILPGFFTDIIGLVFLIPFSRPYARRVLGFMIARQTGASSSATGPGYTGGTVIPGETVDDPQPGASSPRTDPRGELLD
jgi:Protein affecting phage T7 exclusion by the F plasmid